MSFRHEPVWTGFLRNIKSWNACRSFLGSWTCHWYRRVSAQCSVFFFLCKISSLGAFVFALLRFAVEVETALYYLGACWLVCRLSSGLMGFYNLAATDWWSFFFFFKKKPCAGVPLSLHAPPQSISAKCWLLPLPPGSSRTAPIILFLVVLSLEGGEWSWVLAKPQPWLIQPWEGKGFHLRLCSFLCNPVTWLK